MPHFGQLMLIDSPEHFLDANLIFKMRRVLGRRDSFHGETSQSHDSILDRILQLSNYYVHLSHRHVTVNSNFENAYDERSGSSQPKFLDTFHLAVRMDH